jgi:hypothetical protein
MGVVEKLAQGVEATDGKLDAKPTLLLHVAAALPDDV